MKCLICTFPVTAQFEIQRADLVMESLWIIGGKWSLHIKQILHYIGIYFSFGPFTKALVNLCFVKRPVKNKYQYTWYNAVFVYHCLIHVLFRHYEMLHINCWNNDIGRYRYLWSETRSAEIATQESCGPDIISLISVRRKIFPMGRNYCRRAKINFEGQKLFRPD